MSKDIDDVKNSFLKDEYFKLQDQYEDYDSASLKHTLETTKKY